MTPERAEGLAERLIASGFERLTTEIVSASGSFDEQVRVLGSDIAAMLSWADLSGRGAMHAEAGDQALDSGGVALRRGARRDGPAPVTFEAAIRDLLERKPALARSAARVRAVYARHGFALARSASLELTQRVQKALARSVREGLPEERVTERLARIIADETGDWSRSYARTVARTNLTRAFATGRVREVVEGGLTDVVVGFEIRTAGDRDVRPNHRAFEGWMQRPSRTMVAPPFGFSCRCALIPIDRFEAKRRRLLGPDGRLRERPPPPGARFDAGFAPDAGAYG